VLAAAHRHPRRPDRRAQRQRPEIYPVNHLVDRGTIVFRTDPGTKQRGLLRSPAVCNEADGLDTHTA
jgi:hypothetical protein